MLRICRLVCLACLLTGTSAWAQQGASSSTTVEWAITLQGETILIDAKTNATQAPAQRGNSSPDYLEVSFPKARISSGTGSRAIDKGLVQRVQTVQDGENATVRVFYLSKPKTSLTKTATGYRYTVRMSEPATPPSAARPAASPPPQRATQPVVAPKTAETKPASAPPQTTPPAQAATPPASATVQPVTQPSTPVVVNPRISTPQSGPQTPINVVFKDKPLLDAIREIAGKAGYSTQLDPKLSGVVNLSLSEVPFEQALAMLLQPYGDAVSANIGSSSVTVVKNSPNPEPATPSSSIVSEYYPFSTKDAAKMMEAARKAVPELDYKVDPVLNILMVQGPREDVVRLGEILRSMSNK